MLLLLGALVLTLSGGVALAQLPTLDETVAPRTNFDVSAATYLSGPNDDDLNAVDIAPDGTVVLGGSLPGYVPPEGTTLTVLPGGIDGALLRLDDTGRRMLSLTRIGGTVADLEIDSSGQIVACGDFGVTLLDAFARTAIWSTNPGDGAKRCAIGAADGTVALMTGGTVHLYDRDGVKLGSWEANGKDEYDVAVDSANELVIVTSYKQFSANLKIAFIRAWSYDGTLRWRSYDFNGSDGLGADTEGKRVAIGRDGLLYFAATINGGTGASIFARDPKDLNQSAGDRTVKTDDYNNPTNIGSVTMTWYGRYDPADGSLILGQSLLTRRTSDNKGNSASPHAIMADEAGRVFVTGGLACCIANRGQLQVAGQPVGDYSGIGEPFFLAVQPDFQERIVWTPLNPEGGAASGSPAVGVSARDGTAAFVVSLQDDRSLITHNPIQPQPIGNAEGYAAVWRYAAPALSVDAGADQEVFAGEIVTLQGSATGAESVLWSQTDGVPVTFPEPPTNLEITFQAPEVAGTLTFELTVTDAGGREISDTVQVVVNPISVEAGENQRAYYGEEVTLRGTGVGVETYDWTQTDGETVTLQETGEPGEVIFTAPSMDTTLEFELTGVRGGANTSDRVTVEVRPLVADAGPDRVVAVGGSETLRLTLESQSRSSEDITDYSWEQSSGPTDVVQLGDTMQPTLALTLTLSPETRTLDLGFTLTVSNTLGQDTDTVNVLLREGLYLPIVSQ
jgi:hypothetical protein